MYSTNTLEIIQANGVRDKNIFLSLSPVKAGVSKNINNNLEIT